MSYKSKIYLLFLPGNISLNPTDSGSMSSTTLFFCSFSESASALSKVEPSFSALDVTDLQINPFLKRRELELTILEEENNCLTHLLALRSLFSNVKEITRKCTHSFPRLNVFHFEHPFLQCQRHKDRELSLVLDLEPKPTFINKPPFQTFK